MKSAALKVKHLKIKPKQVKKITILGSTGTIGQNTIKLIENSPDAYEVEALTAHNNVAELAEQAKNLNARLAVIANKNLYAELKERLKGTGIIAAAGEDAVDEAASRPADFVMAAIVGAAGLRPALKAIEQGAVIGMANKECLVCAGSLIKTQASKNNSSLIPVDSEHNSIFQVFDFDHTHEVNKITLTASGGPFLFHDLKDMERITPEQAVKHPNWKMGAKISVDSATMMNKGLELIEAYHLFPVSEEQIDVIIHPESIIHGLVSYIDGSVKAGLSTPDMKIPISYALGWPKRINNPSNFSLADIGKLTFHRPDDKKFPALKLARQALKEGKSAPIVLNAANEIAVKTFLNGEIAFLDIARIVELCLEKIKSVDVLALDDIMQCDVAAREYARSLVKKFSNRK